jgi:hypothetical protein
MVNCERTNLIICTSNSERQMKRIVLSCNFKVERNAREVMDVSAILHVIVLMIEMKCVKLPNKYYAFFVTTTTSQLPRLRIGELRVHCLNY